MPLLKNVTVALEVNYEITDRHAVFAAVTAAFDDPEHPDLVELRNDLMAAVTWLVMWQLDDLPGLKHLSASGTDAVGP